MRELARMQSMRRSPSISHFMRRAAASALRAACLCLALIALNTACEEGAVRKCSHVLETSEDLVHCMQSTQECHDGAWSPCGEKGGALIVRHRGAAPNEDGPGADTLSISTPSSSVGNCNADPCNPGCMGFDEHPPAPLKGGTSTTGFVNMSEW